MFNSKGLEVTPHGPKTNVVLFNFENADQLKEKLDSLADFNIMSIVPMKYKAAEMGESEKLVSVIIIYQ